MVAAMEVHGNASSIHAEGRKARKLMDDAREQLGIHVGLLAADDDIHQRWHRSQQHGVTRRGC